MDCIINPKKSDISVMITVKYSTGLRRTFARKITTASHGIFKDVLARRLYEEYRISDSSVISVKVK
jgi:hypothetical protein